MVAVAEGTGTKDGGWMACEAAPLVGGVSGETKWVPGGMRNPE